jgi:hypothetical protein
MTYRILLTIVGCLLLTSCATHNQPDVIRDPYGLLAGIWHGLVFPLALVSNIIALMVNLLIAIVRILLVTFDLSWQMVNGITALLNVIATPINSVEIIGRPNTGLFYYLGFLGGLLSWAGLLGSASTDRKK